MLIRKLRFYAFHQEIRPAFNICEQTESTLVDQYEEALKSPEKELVTEKRQLKACVSEEKTEGGNVWDLESLLAPLVRFSCAYSKAIEAFH